MFAVQTVEARVFIGCEAFYISWFGHIHCWFLGVGDSGISGFPGNGFVR